MATTDQRNRVAFENDGNRVDGHLKATGAAKYTYDINRPGMLHAMYIRAPFGDATIKSANIEAARAVAGVKEIVLYANRGTGAEAATLPEVMSALYSGEAIGHVCAESRNLCMDAISALAMEWTAGAPATDFKTLSGGDIAPDLGPEDQAALDALKASAKFSAVGNYFTQTHHHNSLETHGAVVEVSAEGARAWGSTQGTASFAGGLATNLGMGGGRGRGAGGRGGIRGAGAQVEVDATTDAVAANPATPRTLTFSCDFVGGGFGSKLSGSGIEGTLAARMATKFNAPVKVMLSRKEEATDTGYRPGSRQYYEIYADEAGKILGIRYQTWGAGGAGQTRGTGVRQTAYSWGTVVPNARTSHTDISLAACPPRPQRAPGCPQAAFAVEGILDQLAAAAGKDPIEIRKLNEGRAHQSRLALYDIAAKEIGWDRRKADGQWEGTKKRGFGVGSAEWGNGAPGACPVDLRIFRDGHLEARSGTQDIGTGTKTALVDLVAHQIGISRTLVIGMVGQNDYPSGPASGGSTVTRALAPSAQQVADQAKAAIIALAAAELKVDATTLDIKDGSIVAGSEKKMTWQDACKLIQTDPINLMTDAAAARGYFGTGDSDGVAAAEVEVDMETGVVKLIKIVNVQHTGIPVNRKTTESQIVGGTIQGIGMAMFEERILNAQTGAAVNANMEWFKLPGPADMPEIVPILHVPDGVTGVMAAGEPPMIGVTGAIGNAVANAIGARVFELPLTPDRVLAAIKSKAAAPAAAPQGGQA